MRFNLLIRLLPLLILPCCQIQKPYQYPLTITPNEWKEENQDESKSLPIPPTAEKTFAKETDSRQVAIDDLSNWWEIFEDPLLNQLEQQAIDLNYNLQATFERVIEARAFVVIQQAALYPSINFSPIYLRNQSLIKSPISLTQPIIPGVKPAPPLNPGLPPNVLRFLYSEYTLPFNFQYEVDLWNRIHNAYYAAVYREQAATEDYYNVLLSLTSEVAIHYFQLRDLDFQKQIVEDTIKTRKMVFDILQERYKAGLIPYLDVSRAGVNYSNAESDSVNITRLRSIEENAIAALVGQPASIFSLDFNPVTIPPPAVPAGLPSELLCRRPDIMEAERKIAAAYADIGVAYAGFFPSLNLNAAIGLESPVSSILLNWKSRYWQIGADVFQLIFDAGKTQATVDLATARFRQEFDLYQQTVLNAFEEVETALVNLREESIQAKVLSDSVEWSQLTLDLSAFRYRQGLVSFLDVSTAEKDLLDAKQSYAIVLGNRYVNTVRLIQALGGGW